ncbi:MAG: hypothetical protein HY430_01870 [Candidatus Levybacteria bacterium]|nr:hypothetical protein [Candidatus Levybacteria bacterium]
MISIDERRPTFPSSDSFSETLHVAALPGDNHHPSVRVPPTLDTISCILDTMELRRKLTPEMRDTIATFQLWTHYPSAPIVADMLEQDENTVQSRIDTVYNDPTFDAYIFEFERVAEESSIKSELDELFDEVLLETEETLTPREYEVFTYANKGLTNRQIADILSIEPRTVVSRLVSARKKIETLLLFPREIKELTSYKRPNPDPEKPDIPDNRLRGAASFGTLKTRMFLRKRYTTDALVQDYFRRRRTPDPEWLAQGRILLIDNVIRTEWYSFVGKKQYEPFLFRHPESGLIYTTHENIAIMRSMRKPRLVDQEWLAQGRVPLFPCVSKVEWDSFSRRKQYAPYIFRHPDSGLIYSTPESIAIMRSIRKPRNKQIIEDREEDADNREIQGDIFP